MVLKDLLSISGQGGLFKFVSQGRSGVIVENIETKKRTNVPATAKMSSLEDIAIFTEDEEIPLSEVMDKIFEKENGGPTISHKSDANDLKKLMAELLPDYDQERVYVSDMKKLFQWYNLLQKHEMLIQEEKEEETKKKEEENEKQDGPPNEDKLKVNKVEEKTTSDSQKKSNIKTNKPQAENSNKKDKK